MQQIAYFFHPDGRRESGNNFRTALLSVFSKMTRELIFSDKLMLCDSVMMIHERHKLRRGWNEEFKITLLLQVTLLWSPAVWSTSQTSLWDQRRLTPPAPVNFFSFSVQGFRSTGWLGGVSVSPPGRGPSGWDRAHCPLPVAGWSRSTPCPRAGRWSTPPRESDILWTTTRAPPPLKTPGPGLSQGKYSLNPSSKTCFFFFALFRPICQGLT